MKNTLSFTLIACVLMLVGCGGTGSGPGDRVEEFAHALEKGDVEKVKEISPGMSAVFSGDKLDGLIKESAADMKEQGGIKNITIDEEKIDGDTATVSATIEMGNGDKESDTFQLSQVDGEWLITLDQDKDNGGDNMMPMPGEFNMEMDMDVDMSEFENFDPAQMQESGQQ